jgi:hypothetical protein
MPIPSSGSAAPRIFGLLLNRTTAYPIRFAIFIAARETRRRVSSGRAAR